jgi:hypothetical protein
VQWELPVSVDVGSRSILAFGLKVDNLDDVHIVFRINGVEVWNWNYGEGERVMFFTKWWAQTCCAPARTR